MKTMRVQSLKLRLILQMLVILLPVTLLLGYQAWMDQRRAEIVDRAYQLASKAKQAHERYRSFVQGVSDAVDTGRVSRSAMAALEQARRDIDDLVADDPRRDFSAVAAALEPVAGA